MHGNGHFYICGNIQMASDVKNTLLSVIQRHGNMTDYQSDAYLNKMKVIYLSLNCFPFVLSTSGYYNGDACLNKMKIFFLLLNCFFIVLSASSYYYGTKTSVIPMTSLRLIDCDVSDYLKNACFEILIITHILRNRADWSISCLCFILYLSAINIFSSFHCSWPFSFNNILKVGLRFFFYVILILL